MASGPYNQRLLAILNAYFGSGTFYAMLLNGHTENRDTHNFLSSVRANEVPNGDGYTTNGNIIVPTVSLDNAENRVTVTFPQTTWPSATITASHTVYYKELGADGVDELCFINDYSDSGPATISSSNDTFTSPACTFWWDFANTD